MIDGVQFSVAELRDRAGENVFQSAGQHVVDLDGPPDELVDLVVEAAVGNREYRRRPRLRARQP